MSLELALLSSVVVAGVVPQMTSYRDSINDGLASIGTTLHSVTETSEQPQQTYQPTCLMVCESQWQTP